MDKMLDPFFTKKAPAATPPAEKTCFLPIKNLFGKKKPNPQKIPKNVQNFGPFFRFFGGFGFFLPYRFFISKKQVFSAGGVAAGAFFYEKKVQKI